MPHLAPRCKELTVMLDQCPSVLTSSKKRKPMVTDLGVVHAIVKLKLPNLTTHARIVTWLVIKNVDKMLWFLVSEVLLELQTTNKAISWRISPHWTDLWSPRLLKCASKRSRDVVSKK